MKHSSLVDEIAEIINETESLLSDEFDYYGSPEDWDEMLEKFNIAIKNYLKTDKAKGIICKEYFGVTYKEVRNQLDQLNALLAAGVDNWIDYEVAMDIVEEYEKAYST
jgi:hypothetical protein